MTAQHPIQPATAPVLFWDIDGTLLTTDRAGMVAWNQAVKELTGHDFDLKTAIRTAGFTDHQIADRTYAYIGVQPGPDDIARLVGRYEELLPSSLPTRQGRVLDNVRGILETLARERPLVRSYLLTGNTRAGAAAKLTHYDLLHFFPEGAFCIDTGERAGIARRALEMARLAGPVHHEAIVVIGDTPHDIECANAIGAKTIAVATGGYSLDELLPHGPWRAFDSLPEPPAFVDLIDSLLATGGPGAESDAGA